MLDPQAYPIERAEVRPGVETAFVRVNPGGEPLLLVHGWPETMRIWWRNLEPLAAAGFEVIVPDLRGFGHTGPAADGFYDFGASARDLHGLVHDVLGHERCVAAAGDYGGGVVQDLSLRFEGFVARQCLFNTVVPFLGDAYDEAGIGPAPPPRARMASDYFLRHGHDADGLAAELDTAEKRRRYVAQFYGSRFWSAPGKFTPEEVDFMTEPFADADGFRASISFYEAALGARPPSEVPRLFEVNPTPTLVLYGPDDHVTWEDFPQRCEVAFPDRTGPFTIPDCGHFLQWEQAEVLNGALTHFLRGAV